MYNILKMNHARLDIWIVQQLLTLAVGCNNFLDTYLLHCFIMLHT